MRTRSRRAAAAFAAATGLMSGAAAAADHYTCYKAKFDPKLPKREVRIQDQFDPAGSSHRVLEPFWFCAPTARDGAPIEDQAGHLACYKLKKQKRRTTVQVQNQLGVRTANVKQSQLLCLATEKNDEGAPAQLDDFLCYKSKFTPKPAKRDVTLVDQFGTLETKTRKPQFLCNPAAVDGDPIEDPLNHLECHAIKRRKVKVTATAANAFGTATVTTKKAVALCIPSSKSEPGATTTTVPGGTTTTTLPGAGRAVQLDFDTGSLAAGAVVCLERVTGGCVADGDPCGGPHLHHAIGITGEAGTFPDPDAGGCGHGEIVPSQPGCGTDTVPDCE